jgi:ABC-type uncharacterized transport system involved in gliding motility auxiliary subunit
MKKWTGKKARFRRKALFTLLLVMGLTWAVNGLAARHPLRWDLTQDKENSLSRESIALLSQLKEPVLARAFFINRLSPGQAAAARELLREFEIQSGGKFSFEFIDPEKEPILAQNAEVSQDGSILLVMGERKHLVTSPGEQPLVDGLRRLAQPEPVKAYLLMGHGERGFQSGDHQGFSRLRNDLELKNFSLEPLTLLTVESVPDDAELVMVMGPVRPFDPAEIHKLNSYLDQGGSLVAFFEPVFMTDFGDKPEPLTSYLRERWGIRLAEDVVIDLTTNQATFIAYGVEYGNHPISASLENQYTVFPSARSVMLENKISAGVSQQNLVLSSQKSWAETDMQGLQDEEAEVIPDEGVDYFGPVPLAVAAENFDSQARVVVLGDVDIVSNAFYQEYANREFILNMLDWAARQDEQIQLSPRKMTERVVLPPQESIRNLIFFVVVILIPLIILGFGILVTLERRRRG